MLVRLTQIEVAAGALLLTLVIAACGGGSSYGTSTASTPAATRVGASSLGSPASSETQKQLTITAKDFSFNADAVNVVKGDAIAITFKNSGSAPHTLAFYSDAAHQNAIAGADTGSVSGGGTATLTVKVGDGLFYRCNIHPSLMQGEIAIKSTQALGPTPAATSAAAVASAPTAPPAPAEAVPTAPPPAPADPTVPPQAPTVAATPIPPATIAPSPTHSVATPTKTTTPSYGGY